MFFEFDGFVGLDTWGVFGFGPIGIKWNFFELFLCFSVLLLSLPGQDCNPQGP